MITKIILTILTCFMINSCHYNKEKFFHMDLNASPVNNNHCLFGKKCTTEEDEKTIQSERERRYRLSKERYDKKEKEEEIIQAEREKRYRLAQEKHDKQEEEEEMKKYADDDDIIPQKLDKDRKPFDIIPF